MAVNKSISQDFQAEGSGEHAQNHRRNRSFCQNGEGQTDNRVVSPLVIVTTSDHSARANRMLPFLAASCSQHLTWSCTDARIWTWDALATCDHGSWRLSPW
ncbi:hypothetical protein GJAV_G00076730 [Gymnothorax javanicus]|nr:hypothetical protein GJAV_G00076730 [Gymnothorax javanicus]